MFSTTDGLCTEDGTRYCFESIGQLSVFVSSKLLFSRETDTLAFCSEDQLGQKLLLFLYLNMKYLLSAEMIFRPG